MASDIASESLETLPAATLPTPQRRYDALTPFEQCLIDRVVEDRLPALRYGVRNLDGFVLHADLQKAAYNFRDATLMFFGIERLSEHLASLGLAAKKGGIAYDPLNTVMDQCTTLFAPQSLSSAGSAYVTALRER